MRSHYLLTKPQALFAAMFSFLVGGCAVLTVDVDVYKGALVNSPRIQTKQLAAMAMAAKPLLESLSNNLAPRLQQPAVANSFITITNLLCLYKDVPTNSPEIERARSVYGAFARTKSAYSNLTNTFVPVVRSGAGIANNAPLNNALQEFRSSAKSLVEQASPIVSVSNLPALKLAGTHIESVDITDENDGDQILHKLEALSAPFATITNMPDWERIYKDSLGTLKGRPTKGLETLITEFENDSMTNSSDDEHNLRGQALLVGIVNFAEIVKFIADNQAFINGARKDKRDALTLQAVGNAMLSVADTIARREGFEQTFAVSSNAFKRVEWIGFQTANAYLASAGNQSATNNSVPSAKASPAIAITSALNEGTSLRKGAASTTLAGSDASITFTMATAAAEDPKDEGSTPIDADVASIKITNPAASIIASNAHASISTKDGATVMTITNIMVSITTTNKGKPALTATITNADATITLDKAADSTNATSAGITIAFRNTTSSISITSAIGSSGKSLVKSTTPGQKTRGGGANQDALLDLPEKAADPAKMDIRAAQEMLVQSLRDIQVTATLDGDKARATNAQAALDLAMAYRAENIEILPAMNYLRNSYPATSLQQGSDGLWHNMLAQQGLRSQPWPFGEYPFGEYFLPWLSNPGAIGKDAQTQAEIDKQFWQNINRVRVAGSGLTSYVITKDDIGNWYVKSYTADPSNIIAGAQSLIPASKLANTAKGVAAAASSKITQTNGSTNVLTKEYSQIYNDYTNKTVNQAIDLTNFVASLNPVHFGAAKAASTNASVTTVSTSNFTNYLEGNLKTLADSLSDPTNFTTIAKAQVDLLYQLKRFSAAESKDAATTNSYGCYVTNTVPKKLKRFADDRLETLNTYSAQLGVLSKVE